MPSKTTWMKETKSIKGHKITMSMICHRDKKCKEIIIEPPKFSYVRFLLWTIFLYSIGLYFKLHFQEVMLMLGMIVILLVILMIKMYFKVKQESLLVVASVGVQLTTEFVCGRSQSMFFNSSEIRDIAINEGISMHQVIYYICLLLHNCSEGDKITGVVPLFVCSWPPLTFLTKIRKEVRPLLLVPSSGELQVSANLNVFPFGSETCLKDR